MRNNKLLELNITTDYPGPNASPWTTTAIYDFLSTASDVMESAISSTYTLTFTRPKSFPDIMNNIFNCLIRLPVMPTAFWQQPDWITLIKYNFLKSITNDHDQLNEHDYKTIIRSIQAYHLVVISIRIKDDSRTVVYC